jgi:membrane protein
MTLAAQAFTSLFPVIIVVASVGPNRSDSLGTRLGDALSLPDTARSVLEQALPTQTQSPASFGLIGLLIVVLSATSFSRALARMYARAWHVQPVGWSSGWR